MNRRVRLTAGLGRICETKFDLPSTKSVPMFVRPQNHFQDLGQSKCEASTFVILQQGNAASISPRVAPRISGLVRLGHTSNSTVVSDVLIASISRPIACCAAVSKSWKVPVSRTSRNPVLIPELRSAVTSPLTRCMVTPARCTRSRARSSAFSTMSIPVTCQPRFANWIPQIPLPVPRSSAAPNGALRPFSSRSINSHRTCLQTVDQWRRLPTDGNRSNMRAR